MTSAHPARAIKITAGIIVAAVLVFCAVTVGSPWERRKQLMDRGIIADIGKIVIKLQEIKNEGHALPASLEEVKCYPYEWANAPAHEGLEGCATRDVTYERLTDDSAKFCATFLLPGSRARQEYGFDAHYPYSEFDIEALEGLIAHPAGHFCFTAQIRSKKDN